MCITVIFPFKALAMLQVLCIFPFLPSELQKFSQQSRFAFNTVFLISALRFLNSTMFWTSQVLFILRKAAFLRRAALAHFSVHQGTGLFVSPVVVRGIEAFAAAITALHASLQCALMLCGFKALFKFLLAVSENRSHLAFLKFQREMFFYVRWDNR